MANEPSDSDVPKLPKGFNDDHDLKDIYRWIKQQCNEKPIAELIDEVQSLSKFAKKEILKGGSVDVKIRALRRAVAYKLLPIERLVELLRDHEESGQQWIFLYAPKGADLNCCNNPDLLAKKLFDGVSISDFPRFEWPNNELVWADFRVRESSRGRDWVIKLYEHAPVKKVIESKKGQRQPHGVFRDFTDYRYDDAYLCHVLRWTAGLRRLEVRIDKEKSKGVLAIKQTRLDGVTDMVLPAFSLASMPAWSLSAACMRLLTDRHRGASEYRFGHVRLQTGDRGKSNLFPFNSKCSLDQDAGRKMAVDEILRHNGKLLEACINFKVPKGLAKPQPLKEGVDSEVGNDDELRTIIGGEKWNEVSISSRITPKLLDYVLAHICRTDEK